MKKEIKHIRKLGEVLQVLANEIEKRGYFTQKDLELLKEVGSTIVFKGCSLDYTQSVE